jgi:hypothetical protein
MPTRKKTLSEKAFQKVQETITEFLGRARDVDITNQRLNKEGLETLKQIISACENIKNLDFSRELEIWQYLQSSVVNFRTWMIELETVIEKTKNFTAESFDSIELLHDSLNRLAAFVEVGKSVFHNDDDDDDDDINIGALAFLEHATLKDKLSKLQTDLEGLQKSAEKQIEDKTQELFRLYEAAVQRVVEEDKQITAWLNKIATGVLAGGHSKTARNKLISANCLLTLAFALMLIPAALLIWTLIDSHSDKLNLVALASRVSVTIFMSIPITYLIREAGRFRNIGNRYLQTALDLSALDSYLASLPTELQQQTKAALATKMFFSYDGSLNIDYGSVNIQEFALKALEVGNKNK